MTTTGASGVSTIGMEKNVDTLSHMFIVVDSNIGDSICAMAAIQYVVENVEAPIYLQTLNRETEYLMKPLTKQIIPLHQLPTTSELMHVHKLDVGQAIRDYKFGVHLINAYLQQMGVYLDYTPQPKLTEPFISIYEREQPNYYDIVIAPWSADARRTMTAADFVALMDRMIVQFPRKRIGILGGEKDGSPYFHPNVIYEYGNSLATVACIMRNAHHVITVDSGMNRWAHAALDPSKFAVKHTVLVPYHIPDIWAGHEHAILIRSTQDKPQHWDNDEIIEVVSNAWLR